MTNRAVLCLLCALLPVAFTFVLQQPEQTAQESELLLVQFLFRHGDRTPISLYPNDPYLNYSFPEGFGELTGRGKQRLYGYGKALRQRYSDYVKGILLKNVEANSSPLRRCIETNQLVLAGMLPPEGPWSPNDTISHEWVPIAVETTEVERAWLLSPDSKCPKADKISNDLTKNDPEMKEFLDDHREFINKTVKASGLDYTNWLQLAWLYDTLAVEGQYFGDKYRAPNWLTQVGVKTAAEAMSLLKQMNDFQFSLFGKYPEFLRLRTGLLLNRVINNMKGLATKSKQTAEERKLYTFSSHDNFIAYVLHALGAFKEQPRYGSGLIFELRKHRAQPEPFVQMFYANVTNNNEIYQLPLNESKTFEQYCTSWECPLSSFASALQTYILPNNDAVEKACQL